MEEDSKKKKGQTNILVGLEKSANSATKILTLRARKRKPWRKKDYRRLKDKWEAVKKTPFPKGGKKQGLRGSDQCQ